jgi:subtilisin family serine protease
MKKTLFALMAVSALAATATSGELVRARAGKALPNRYIVVLKEDVTVQAGGAKAGFTVSQMAVSLATRHRGRATHVYERALRGFAAELTEAEARRLADSPEVAFVEEDIEMQALATQAGATFGLDRIDQRNLPLSGSYTFNFTGAGVHAYIIDTGVRAAHQDFGGRVSPQGFTAINDGQGTNDCNGHGTHVAGTVGSNTWGVAKGVTLHAVRVLGCTGSGSNAGVIAGVDWVTQNHVKPAVANMSLGGGISAALDAAINNSINAGVTYAVAAGNSNANACNSSPSRVPAALTVGATTSTDARSSFSNIGTCVDVFAPGSAITSTWSTSNTATNTISGTSMASPHVAGVAALYLQQFPGQSPAQVHAAVVSNATPNVVGNAGAGSPNRLLHSLFGGGGGGTTVFADDFEADRGWTRNPGGTDTATTGVWERGDPQATVSTGTKQVETCAGGSNCLVTGLAAGASVGANDVDGGTTSILSPPIALPASGTLTLSFSYYLAHLNNSSTADFFRVSLVTASATTAVFQELGSTANDNAAFATQSANISALAGQTVRILVQVSDAATGSLVEAAVDNVSITRQ